MNDHEAKTIYRAMRFMARGQANNINARSDVTWCGITCRYYPLSNTWVWFGRGTLCKQEVLPLINDQIDYAAYHRGVQKLVGEAA